MIRPVTCVCVLLAAASGLYLYQSKHRVQLLDRQIEATVRATQAARERTGVLRAEWTVLNDPERLAQLADRFLALKTVTPPQFTTVADLGNRLPPVRIPDPKAPDALPEEPQPDQIAIAPEPEQKPAAPIVAKAEPKPAPKVVAVRIERPAERPPERKPAQLAMNAVPPAPAVQRVSTRSMVAPVSTAVPLSAPVPVARPIQASYTPSGGYAPALHSARAVPPVDGYSGVAVGSALGVVHSALPSPVPYSQSNGN